MKNNPVAHNHSEYQPLVESFREPTDYLYFYEVILP